jgi:hypothetical protein
MTNIKMAPPGYDEEAKRIKFDFIKGNYFRVIHVDGVYGGFSPQGLFQMAVWNERWPIPRQTIHEISPNGQLGKEIPDERTTRNAVVREVEAQLVMDISQAKNMLEWLKEKIEAYEGEKKPPEKGEKHE